MGAILIGNLALHEAGLLSSRGLYRLWSNSHSAVLDVMDERIKKKSAGRPMSPKGFSAKKEDSGKDFKKKGWNQGSRSGSLQNIAEGSEQGLSEGRSSSADIKSSFTAPKSTGTKSGFTSTKSNSADKSSLNEKQSSDTKNPDTKNPDIKNPDTKNPDIKSPNTKSSNIKSSDTKSSDIKSSETKPNPVDIKSNSVDIRSEAHEDVMKYINLFKQRSLSCLLDKKGKNTKASLCIPVVSGEPVKFENIGRNNRSAEEKVILDAHRYIKKGNLMEQALKASSESLEESGRTLTKYVSESKLALKKKPNPIYASRESVSKEKIQKSQSEYLPSDKAMRPNIASKKVPRAPREKANLGSNENFLMSSLNSLKNAGWCNYASNGDLRNMSNSWYSSQMIQNSGMAMNSASISAACLLNQSSLYTSDMGSTRSNSGFMNDQWMLQSLSSGKAGLDSSDKSSRKYGSMDDVISISPQVPRVNIPAFLDQKRFIEYYCAKANLPPLTPILSDNKGKQHANESQCWSVEYKVPVHYINNKRVDVTVNVSECTKKRAMDAARNKLIENLMCFVDDKFVENFHNSTMPFKKRVEELIRNPVSISFSESTGSRLGSLLKVLRSVDAFRIPDSQMEDCTTRYHINTQSKMQFIHPHVQSEKQLNLEDIENVYEGEAAIFPVQSSYREIVQAIEISPVVIISAQTGAGKTTQVPQFILDYYNTSNTRKPSVICTQPRRIAAISISDVVAQERLRKKNITGSVGYSVRFANKPPAGSSEGTILFCTSGVLLSRLQNNPTLEGFTHVILDEVHERDLNTDLLLVIMRHLLTKRSDLRLILMSATAETGVFLDYFAGYGPVGPKKLPVIVTVPGRMFQVNEYYLNDVDMLLRDSPIQDVRTFRPPPDQVEWVSSEINGTSGRFRDESVPYDYLEALIAHICSTGKSGAILVFMPGWQEIRYIHNLLTDDRYRIGFSNTKLYEIHPLHSSIPISAQALVFKKSPPGCRKIILATSIAETSITIDDVVYVVDLGKIRVNSYNPDCRISSLKSQWISISNLRQRMGRAGRTKPGEYYSFISQRRKKNLPYFISPEILRVDLQQVALLIKSLRLSRRIKDVFALAPNPPSLSSIDMVLRQLRLLGALDSEERITPLGEVICRLSLDPWIARMVIMGTIFNCMDSMVTIAALMETSRNLYHITFENREEAWRHIVTSFAGESQSDQLTALTAFRKWSRRYESESRSSRHKNPNSTTEAYDFAQKNYLNYVSCVNVKKHRSHLIKTLSSSGLTKKDDPMHTSYNDNESNISLVRSILAGALYPNLSEIKSRDEYRTFTDRFTLRLTATCVNSWKSILLSQKADSVPNSKSKPLSSSPDPGANVFTPALPVRLVAFQQKQQIDNSYYLRQVTKVSPIALCLFTNFQTLEYVNDEKGAKLLLIDKVLNISLADEEKCALIMELREWIDRYIEWVLWSRCRESKDIEKIKGEFACFASEKSYDGSDENYDDMEETQEQGKPSSVDSERDRLGKALLSEVASLVAETEDE